MTTQIAGPGDSSAGLSSRRILLRTIAQQDLPWLYDMCTSPTTGVHWRFRGATPSVERFANELWSGVLCQYVAETRNGSTPIGLVTLYNADLSNGHAYVGSAGRQLDDRAGRLAESVLVLLDFSFRTWPFRKIYAELAASTLERLSPSLDRYFTKEGTLSEHVYLEGRYQDVTTWSITRETWRSAVGPKVASLLGAGRG